MERVAAFRTGVCVLGGDVRLWLVGSGSLALIPRRVSDPRHDGLAVKICRPLRKGGTCSSSKKRSRIQGLWSPCISPQFCK